MWNFKQDKVQILLCEHLVLSTLIFLNMSDLHKRFRNMYTTYQFGHNKTVILVNMKFCSKADSVHFHMPAGEWFISSCTNKKWFAFIMFNQF